MTDEPIPFDAHVALSRQVTASARPELTVSMPAHNTAPYIRAAIDSVLAQKDVDFELIVVDDGSGDGTGAIASEVNDPRVRVIRNGQRRGIGYSHNVVARESRAPFIVHLDSDDFLIRRDAFRLLLDRIQSDDGLGLVHAYFLMFDQHGNTSRDRSRRIMSFQLRTRKPGRDYRAALLREGSVMNALRLFRKSVFEHTGGFDESLRFGEDYEMALRIAEHYRIDVVPTALVGVRVRADSATQLKLRAFRYWWQRVTLARRLSRSGQITYATRRFSTMLKGLWSVLGLGRLLSLSGQMARGLGLRARQFLERQFEVFYALLVRCMGWWPLRPWPIVLRKRPPRPGICAYFLWQYPGHSETFVRRELFAVAGEGIPVKVFAERRLPDAQDTAGPRAAQPDALFLDGLTGSDVSRYAGQMWRSSPVRCLYLFLYTVFHRYGFYKNFREDVSVFRRAAVLAGVMKSQGVAHIHTPWGDRSAFIAMLAAELLGIRFSAQVRAFDLHRKMQAFALTEKFSAAAFVVSNCQYNHDIVASMVPPRDQARIHLMYEGVTPAEFPPVTLREDMQGTLRILCVARLIEEKGLEYLLLACDELRSRGVNFRCDIVGGPDRSAFTAYEARLKALHRRMNLEPVVKFAGARPFYEVMSYYQAADIFVLPCVFASNGGRDITPNVLIEAMACGLPVVSTRIGAIPEIIDDGEDGLILPPNDPVSIADAVQRLALDSAFRAHIALNARKKVENTFNSARNIQVLTGLLRSRLGNSSPVTHPAN